VLCSSLVNLLRVLCGVSGLFTTMLSLWGACVRRRWWHARTKVKKKRSLPVTVWWVERVMTLVVVYALVHLCLLLAVLMPVLRRCTRFCGLLLVGALVVGGAWRRLSHRLDVFRLSSADERSVSTEPLLPPGATVPEMVVAPPPTVERPRMNEEE
jgi:hypothetical protein